MKSASIETSQPEQIPPPRSLADCEALWAEPGAAYRGKPFWSWNGRLDVDELKRQANAFKEMGMGGYFMHSRTGLATEYLGKEWFAAINAVADESEAIGMEAWIYDEDRWPSGSAGGLATREERFRMKLLRLTVCDGPGFAWPEEEHFLAAFSAELEDCNLGQYNRLEYRQDDTLPEGHKCLLFTWESMPCDSFYNGASYLDTLDPDAVDNFLRVTHDAYGDACGDRLGKSIPGVFTDEPHRGFVMLGEVWSAAADNSAWTAPWTPGLPEAYKEAFGEDFFDALPRIFLQKNGERFSPQKWRYMEVLQRLFLDNFARLSLERSHQHGLALTGHVLHEDSLGAQACPIGAVARYYEYMDVPGIDLLGNANPKYWVAKQVQSVSRQLGKSWILSELYGCTGWGMPLAGHKRIGDWQALFGVNLRCHHLSWYTMEGEAKRDYPASIFFQSPWWQDYAAIETYYARLHTILQSGEPLCDVLVVSPVESLWAQIYPGWAKWLETADEAMAELDVLYQELFHWLAGARIDFDYGDEDHLARLASIEHSEGGPELRLGQMSYRSVVVGVSQTLRKSTAQLLEDFVKAGGDVVFVGEVPAYCDAVPSQRLAKLARSATQLPWEKEPLIDHLATQTVSCHLELNPSPETVFAQIRELPEGWYVVLVNISDEVAPGCVKLRFAQGEAVEMWDALSGEVTTVASEKDAGGLSWRADFGLLTERVFFIRKQASSQVAPMAAPKPQLSAEPTILNGPFDYELGEPNLLVLDTAEWRVGDEAWQPAEEILRVEKALAERMGCSVRNGTMVQPWAREPQKNHIPVALKFSFTVNELPDDGVFLLIEQPEAKQLVLNGQSLVSDTAEEWLIDPCFRRLALPGGVLRKGVNELIVSFPYAEGTDLEAVYLGGKFGVYQDNGTVFVGPLVAQLSADCITQQGLFFYSDHVFYALPVSEPGWLEVEAKGAACVAFHGALGRQLMPWGPFRYHVSDQDVLAGQVRCELILTRRNLFGPLHNIDSNPNMTGPDTFRNEGDSWSDAYVLQEVGLGQARFWPDNASL